MVTTCFASQVLLQLPFLVTTKSNDIFKRRVIKYWNMLPSFVKESNSTIDFKSKSELHKRNSISNGSHRYWDLSQEIIRRLWKI